MRKRIFILLLFIIAFSYIKATDWFPIGAKWYWSHHQYCCEPPLYNTPFTWLSVKDTLIQDKQCKIIERNDLKNERHIFYNENRIVTRYIANKFLPLYDFNIAVGDTTMLVADSGYNSCDTFLLIVDSILPLAQDNQLKVQYGKLISNINCTSFQPTTRNVSIIEKIGLPDVFSTSSFFLTDNGNEDIRCYQDSTTNVRFVNYACDETIISSVKENKKYGLSLYIYPNPASNKIQIENDDFYNNVQIKLIDLHGKTLKYIELNNVYLKKQIIDISNIEKGVYLLNIIADDKFVTKQVIINNKIN